MKKYYKIIKGPEHCNYLLYSCRIDSRYSISKNNLQKKKYYPKKNESKFYNKIWKNKSNISKNYQLKSRK